LFEVKMFQWLFVPSFYVIMVSSSQPSKRHLQMFKPTNRVCSCFDYQFQTMTILLCFVSGCWPKMI